MDTQNSLIHNFLISTNRPAEFIRAACQLHAGPASTLTCEGELTHLQLDDVVVLSRSESTVTVRLAPHDVELVFRYVVACGGVKSRIFHFLIHKNTQLVCAAFDKFADGYVWVEATSPFMNDLLSQGIVRWFGINPNATSVRER